MPVVLVADLLDIAQQTVVVNTLFGCLVNFPLSFQVSDNDAVVFFV